MVVESLHSLKVNADLVRKNFPHFPSISQHKFKVYNVKITMTVAPKPVLTETVTQGVHSWEEHHSDNSYSDPSVRDLLRMPACPVRTEGLIPPAAGSATGR